MRITRRQLRQLIREAGGGRRQSRGDPMTRAWRSRGGGSYADIDHKMPQGLSSQTPSDDLGVLIERAMDKAQIANNQEVYDLLYMAHEALMGL